MTDIVKDPLPPDGNINETDGSLGGKLEFEGVVYAIADIRSRLKEIIEQNKTVFLARIKEFARMYKSNVSDEKGQELICDAVNDIYMALEEGVLQLSDFHDYQYSTDPSEMEFYYDFINAGINGRNANLAREFVLQCVEWLRRHGDPETAKILLRALIPALENFSQRSSAKYEMAMANRALGNQDEAAKWLNQSGKDAQEAGDIVKGLRIVEEAYWWQAQRERPDSREFETARYNIACSNEHLQSLLGNEEYSSDRDTIIRSSFNCYYHLAWMASRPEADSVGHRKLISKIEEAEFFTKGWITVEQFTEVAGRPPRQEILEALKRCKNV